MLFLQSIPLSFTFSSSSFISHLLPFSTFILNLPVFFLSLHPSPLLFYPFHNIFNIHLPIFLLPSWPSSSISSFTFIYLAHFFHFSSYFHLIVFITFPVLLLYIYFSFIWYFYFIYPPPSPVLYLLAFSILLYFPSFSLWFVVYSVFFFYTIHRNGKD